MNILHMKYALAISKTNSINKAAEELFVGAPALSRAIKELETGLGVTLFDRSAKGMFLTPEGELFINYATKILKQIDDIENIFKDGSPQKVQFSISVPRASYIADAFAEFSKKVEMGQKAELFYKETNAYRVINNILKEDYKLGILRYSERYDEYYKAMMFEKGLIGELIAEFTYVLIMSKDSPLKDLKTITFDDINNYTEIAHADPYVPSLPLSEVKKEELPEHNGNRIFVFERGSQFELLSRDPNTYMWVSPVPEVLLDRYGLVERKCIDNKRIYKDVLIHRGNYKLTPLDNMFIEELVKSKRKTL
ncbi:MAG: LysR family transcriptional regulator [Lachnospiraceae bacterium]|nr:LysR family transcriptional regulator [Lachnospiraceae bacterium]